MAYSWLHEELERHNLWGKFTVDMSSQMHRSYWHVFCFHIFI